MTSSGHSKRLATEKRKKEFKDIPKEGLVFRAFSKTANKPKFFVIVGVTKDHLLIGHVLINTRINKNIAITPELETLHIPILASDYAFLDHDSFIDCSKIIDLKYERAQDMFAKNNGQFKGFLTPEHIKSMKYVIGNSPTIKKKILKKYGYR